MVRTVIFTPTARRKLDEMISYLESEVSVLAAQALFGEVVERIEVLRQYPDIGRKSKKDRRVHFVNIGKHRRMYYRFTSKELSVVTLSTNGNHPIKSRIDPLGIKRLYLQ